MDGSVILLVASVSILFTAERALAVVYTAHEWKVNVSSYRRSRTAFAVGDGVVFKMGDGEVDIAQVSKSDYELCSAEAPKAIYRCCPTTEEAIYLNKTGNWYFISRVPDHCKAGKKLMITVVANNSSNNYTHNRARFIFLETSQRMGFGGRGGGLGRGIGRNPGYNIPKWRNPGYSIPEWHRTPHGSMSSGSAPVLSAMDFNFQLYNLLLSAVSEPFV